jgi:hypothetical protein
MNGPHNTEVEDRLCVRCAELHPKCMAHNRVGRPCGQSPIDGGSVCRLHGGRAPAVQAAAERRLALGDVERQVRRTLGARLAGLDREDETPNPEQLLLDAIRRQAALVAVLGDEVVSEEETVEAIDYGTNVVRMTISPVVEFYHQAIDQLAKLCALAIKAGIEERRVRLAEADGMRVFEAVMAALVDPDWGLTAELAEAGKLAIAKHFKRLVAA